MNDAHDPRDPHDAPGPLADALTALLRRALRRGRAEMERAAESSRRRLEIRQMRKDLDHFWVRLGKTAHRLVEAGELDHPALRKAMTRIAELERDLEAVQGPNDTAAREDVAHGEDPE